MKLLKTKLGKLSTKKALILIFSILAIFFSVFVFRSLGELNDLGLLKITGFPGARDYLLVFQNDAERRPTGGFITAYGTLKFRFGIPSIEFGNVYDEKLIQKNEVFPDPTVAELLAGPFYPGHGFRDGNFDPDFPTTAKELMRLYKLGYPEADFDGVIALDFTAFENLAQTVDSKLVGESGLFSEIEKKVQGIDLHNPEEIKDRKNFLGGLAKSIIKKAVFSPMKYSLVSKSLIDSLNSKHIQFYFQDPTLQFRIHEKGWGGELPFAADSDLLAINEGNYGGMKSSRYLVRDYEYDVELQDSEEGLSPIANLQIKIQHRGDSSEPISGYYKSYWRIYVPLESQLVSGSVDRAYDDGKRQVWGKVIQMGPGEEREINLRYELPLSVLQDGSYKLKLVKQAGSADDHARVTVKLPAGYLFKNAKCSSTSLTTGKMQNVKDYFSVRENLAIFEENLNSDKNLELNILPDEMPPRLAWQEFVGGLSTIDLRFNEPLDSASIESAIFEIKDLDYRNERTDPADIRRVRFIAPQNIRLDLSGVSEECREWYELKFDGVSDLHGNVLENQKITVVQWLNAEGEICDPGRDL